MSKVVVMIPKKEVPEEIRAIFQRDRQRGEKAFNAYKMKQGAGITEPGAMKGKNTSRPKLS